MLQAIKGVILILAIGCIAGVRCMDYDRCYEGLAEGEFFAHPEDCSWFFYCIEGDLEPGNCPDNTLVCKTSSKVKKKLNVIFWYFEDSSTR